MPGLRLMFGIVLISTLPCVLAEAENRITRPVDLGRVTVLRGHVPQKALPQYDLGPAASAAAIEYVTLRLKPADGLEQFLEEQRNPSSPNYHRWLTPEQFGDRFGLTTDDLGKLTAWLQSEGLQVREVARGRHWITFSGTVDQLNHAFHTEIHRYRVNGALHLANATDPAIPSAFEDVVSGIDGLSDFHMQPLFRLEQPAFTSATTHYLAPDDFATIYDVTPLYNAGIDGTGEQIAVIGESAIQLSDVRQFRQMFNLPPNDPQLVLAGSDPGITSAVLESNLDIEWAGAVARGASILYVYANSVTRAAQYAVDQNLAPVITFSYGDCEAYSSVALRAIAQQANAQGITWLAASGDWGAATCDLVSSPTPQASKGPNASFPASIPEITAVGGTEFDDGTGSGYWTANNTANGASVVSYVPERTWNTAILRNDLSAGGGGPSVVFSKPNWQTGSGVPNDNARDVPDVALASSPQHYAYIMYSGGSVVHVGGTSAASPSFAGVLALLNQYLAANGSQPGLGNINPTLYRLAQSTTDVFHDITAGDNRVPCEQGSPGCGGSGMGYAAGPGYDLATGLGTIDAYHLVTEWKSGTTTTTVLSAAPSTVSLTDTVTLTAAVSGAAGAPTGSVTFVANDLSLGTAPLSAAGTATVNVPAINLASGNLMLTALYGGDAVFDGSSGTTGIALNLPPSGSLVVPFVSPNPVAQAGSSWPYTVGVAEKAGVATTVTNLMIDGIRQGFWNNTNIPANGTVSTNMIAYGLKAPLNRTFVFSGQDPGGQAWTQQIAVPFLASSGPVLAPAISLAGAPSLVRQNPQADPSCQWSQQLTIQETGGFLVQLTSLRAGSSDFSTQIQQVFGTTRLAPYGSLPGALCWDSTTQTGTKQLQLTGISELGTAVTASFSTVLAGAAAAPPRLSVTPASVQLTGNSLVQSDPFSLLVNLEGGGATWTASVLPANRTTTWLKISGGAPGPLSVIASSAGLANGVYRATIAIDAPDAIPPFVNVPVTLVVGGATNMTISGVRNNASGTVAFAPGMQIAVYGSGLAPSSTQTSRIPLPFSLAGVSATVNGISAPVYAVSPGQIDIQIPYETGLGTAVLAVNNNGNLASYSFPVAVAAPGIYNFFIDDTMGAQNSGRAGDVMTMFASGGGDLTPSLATGAGPPALTPVRGLPKPRLPVTVTVGGEAADVAFAGNASGLVGAIQINFTVPGDLPPGPQPVVLTVGNAASDPVNLTLTQ